MDHKATNRNIPEQTESIIARTSFLLVSSVRLGHILFCSKQTKGTIMGVWKSKQSPVSGLGLDRIQEQTKDSEQPGFRGFSCSLRKTEQKCSTGG